MKNKKIVEIVSYGILDESKKPGDKGYIVMGCGCCLCEPGRQGAGSATASHQGSSKFTAFDHKDVIINI